MLTQLRTVHEKQMFEFPQSHSPAPPPLRLLQGLSPVELTLSFSQRRERCCFNFGFLQLCITNKTTQLSSCRHV